MSYIPNYSKTLFIDAIIVVLLLFFATSVDNHSFFSAFIFFIFSGLIFFFLIKKRFVVDENSTTLLLKETLIEEVEEYGSYYLRRDKHLKIIKFKRRASSPLRVIIQNKEYLLTFEVLLEIVDGDAFVSSQVDKNSKDIGQKLLSSTINTTYLNLKDARDKDLFIKRTLFLEMKELSDLFHLKSETEKTLLKIIDKEFNSSLRVEHFSVNLQF